MSGLVNRLPGERMVWVDASYFTAGVFIGPTSDVIHDAAPIVKWAIGRDYHALLVYLHSRGAVRGFEVISLSNQQRIPVAENVEHRQRRGVRR